jgi:hypothetical protein
MPVRVTRVISAVAVDLADLVAAQQRQLQISRAGSVASAACWCCNRPPAPPAKTASACTRQLRPPRRRREATAADISSWKRNFSSLLALQPPARWRCNSLPAPPARVVLPEGRGIASAVSTLLAGIAFLNPALVCLINDITDFESSLFRNTLMKITKSVKPIQTRRTLIC